MSAAPTPRRRTLVASVAVAAVLAVSGCDAATPTINLNWQPPEWPPAEIALIDTLPAPVDTSTLTLLDHRLRNPDARVQGRFVYLPATENEAFNRALDDIVQAGLTQASAHSGVDYAPQKSADPDMSERGCTVGSTLRPAAEILNDPLQGVGGDGTAIVCDVVVAAGTVFGERIRTVVGGADGAVVSDSASVVYTDTATSDVATADKLWTPEAVDALYVGAVGAIRRANGALSYADANPAASPDARAAFAQALTSTVPTGNGGLAFTIPVGFTTPELDGLGIQSLPEVQQIEVPPELVATLATPLGQSIASAAGEPFVNPQLGNASTDWVNCQIVACVAVTYDDGPSGAYTPQLLDTALEMRVPLTFYTLGSQVEQFPDVVLREHNEGHEVANHTWNHPDLTTLSEAAINEQLVSTSDLIESITGQRPTTFRPPYGAINDEIMSMLSIAAINWSVDTLDWDRQGDPAGITASGINDAMAGGIVLYHDIHPTSVAVAPDVFEGLRDHGLTLVTISRLFGGTPPTEGVWSTATRRWGE